MNLRRCQKTLVSRTLRWTNLVAWVVPLAVSQPIPNSAAELYAYYSHVDSGELSKSGYYWYSGSSVKRGLYMGDTLYTVSDMYVKANDLSTMGAVSSLQIGNGTNDYGGRVY